MDCVAIYWGSRRKDRSLGKFDSRYLKWSILYGEMLWSLDTMVGKNRQDRSRMLR